MGNTATTLHLRSRSAATGEEASDGESHEDEGKGGGEAVVEEGRALPGSEGQGLGKQRIGRAPSSTAVSRMRRFEEEYLLGPLIGSGSFSSVHLCTMIDTGEMYAVKIISRGAAPTEGLLAFDNMIDILEQISHPQIVQLVDVIKDDVAYYLIMEYVPGGELFHRVVQRTCYAEARKLLRILLHTVRYMHSQNIVHLDLKPENLLLVSKDDDCNVKVADFGFAERITELSPTTVGCGTPQYVSPEILQAHPFNSKVDIWSIGIITYILLGGYPPFHDVEKSVLFEKIVKGEFEFHAPFWDHVTEEAKDFIRCMLVVDPAGRYSAWQLLEHPWLSQTEHLDQILPESERFRAHRAQRRFRAAVIAVVASHRFAKMRKQRGGIRKADVAATFSLLSGVAARHGMMRPAPFERFERSGEDRAFRTMHHPKWSKVSSRSLQVAPAIAEEDDALSSKTPSVTGAADASEFAVP